MRQTSQRCIAYPSRATHTNQFAKGIANPSWKVQLGAALISLDILGFNRRCLWKLWWKSFSLRRSVLWECLGFGGCLLWRLLGFDRWLLRALFGCALFGCALFSCA